MRRIITLPAELFGALRSFCLTSAQTKSHVIRSAAAELETITETEAGAWDSPAANRWSQSYAGKGFKRVAVILDGGFDARIRRAAAHQRRSLNAFYTRAIEAWLLQPASQNRDSSAVVSAGNRT